jgi:ADP-ribose pyrophosphatase YjhB (NUDIX family)
VAGYVFAGETYEAAAARRISQELGLRGPALTAIGKTAMIDEGCKKFIELFTTVEDGPFEYDLHHIERLEFLALVDVHKLRDTGLRTFTPTFLHVLNFYEAGRRMS